MAERICLEALTAMRRRGVALAALAVLVITVLVSSWPLQAAERVLYSIAANDIKLRSIDPADGSTLSEVTITLDGPSFTDGAALASDPTSGRLLALLKRSARRAGQ